MLTDTFRTAYLKINPYYDTALGAACNERRIL